MSISRFYMPEQPGNHTSSPEHSTLVTSSADSLEVRKGTEHQPSHNPSIWMLPGLDKETFYAAALYLHAAAGQLGSKPWISGPRTPNAIRDFLDRLADCFARSKLADARDHVSATAMVRVEAPRKLIKLYIAKNHNTKAVSSRFSPGELCTIWSENEEFANMLIKWFNDMASNRTRNDGFQGNPSKFKIMCDFGRSRLEHYINKISDADVDLLDRVVLADLERFRDGWTIAKDVISQCRLYRDNAKKVEDNKNNSSPESLQFCALLAGQARRNLGFRGLSDKVNMNIERPKLRSLPDVVKWIDYLGRLYAACLKFFEFCTDYEQNGYTFEYELLPSQEDDWEGKSYMERVKAWPVDLGPRGTPSQPKTPIGKPITIEETMDEVINRIGDNKARVHCEMQLMMHFSKPNAEQCFDYFGCSKKSCWLCWQMLIGNTNFSMKGTHRKLYPRWAFPFDLSPSQPEVAQALTTAYNEMLRVIQNNVLHQAALGSYGSELQSSARVTPAQRKDMTYHSGLGLFSDFRITVANLFPAIRAPALRLPADGSPEELKEIWIYERINKPESMASLIIPFDYGDEAKELNFAFELLTVSEPGPSRMTPEDALRRFWSRGTVHTDEKLDGYKAFLVFYRSSDELDPNPFILSAWTDTYGDLHQQRDFPWRGDVFVFLTHWETLENSSWLETIRKFFKPDIATFLKEQRQQFKLSGASYAATKMKENLLHADELSELANI